MANFSFNDNEFKVSKAIAPYGIYDVIFKGCEYKTGESNGKKWESFNFRFETEIGEYYSDCIFFDEATANERRTMDLSNGGKLTYPSSYEVTMKFFVQLIKALNPEGLKTMQGSTYNSFKEVCDKVIEILSPKLGTKTKIKLDGKNVKGNIKACLPKFVKISKNGEAYMSDLFIGKDVKMTPYELGKRNAYFASVPSKPQDNSGDILAVSNDTSDNDLSGLLDEIGD